MSPLQMLDLAVRIALTIWMFWISYSDRRDGLIPNKLTAPVFLGVGLFQIVYGILTVVSPLPNEWYRIFAIPVAYAIIFGLWMLHFIGGGDAKFLMALFALFPTMQFVAVLALVLLIITVPIFIWDTVQQKPASLWRALRDRLLTGAVPPDGGGAAGAGKALRLDLRRAGSDLSVALLGWPRAVRPRTHVPMGVDRMRSWFTAGSAALRSVRGTLDRLWEDLRGGTAVQAMVILPVVIIAMFTLIALWQLVSVRRSLNNGTYLAMRYVALYPVEPYNEALILLHARDIIENELFNNPFVRRQLQNDTQLSNRLNIELNFVNQEYSCKSPFVLRSDFNFPMSSMDPFPGVSYRLFEEREGEILCQ